MEHPATPTIYPLTFSGSAAAAVAVGTSVKSDALTGVTIPAGATCFVRQHYALTTLGHKIPLGFVPYGYRDEGTFAASQTLTVDGTGAAANATSIGLASATTAPIRSGTPLLFGAVMAQASADVAAGATALPVTALPAAVAANATASHYDPALNSANTRTSTSNVPYAGPIRMTGQAYGNPAATIVYGDSKFAGYNDGLLGTNGTTAPLGTEFGWTRRIFSGSRPFMNLARTGEKAQHINTAALFARRLPYVSAGDHRLPIERLETAKAHRG